MGIEYISLHEICGKKRQRGIDTSYLVTENIVKERNSINKEKAESNTEKETSYKIGKTIRRSLIMLNVSVEKTACGKITDHRDG